MKLVKITCELRYLERMKLLSRYEDMYRDLLKKEPEEAAQWLTPAMRFEDKERKRLMVFDLMRSAIDIEQPPNTGFCRDLILQFASNLDEKFGIPKVGRWGLRSTWIEEYNGDFKQLLDRYKQIIFGNSAIVEKVDDVGAVFDYYLDDGKKLVLTTGPMKIEQLKKQFLTFEPQSISPIFMYIDIDMGDIKTTQYSSKYLQEFFSKAIEEGERLAKEIIKLIGEKNGHG